MLAATLPNRRVDWISLSLQFRFSEGVEFGVVMVAFAVGIGPFIIIIMIRGILCEEELVVVVVAEIPNPLTISIVCEIRPTVDSER